MERKKNFAKNVDEFYRPKVSEKKKKELEDLRRANFRVCRTRVHSPHPIFLKDKTTETEKERREVNWQNLINPMIPKKKEITYEDQLKKQKYHENTLNYLGEQRRRRIEIGSDLGTMRIKQIDSHLHKRDQLDSPISLKGTIKGSPKRANSDFQSVDKAKAIAQRAQLEAVRAERLLKYQDQKKVQDEIDVSERYLSAVNAKMEILN